MTDNSYSTFGDKMPLAGQSGIIYLFEQFDLVSKSKNETFVAILIEKLFDGKINQWVDKIYKIIIDDDIEALVNNLAANYRVVVQIVSDEQTSNAMIEDLNKRYS